MQPDRCARPIAILLFVVSLVAGGACLASAQQPSDITGLSAEAVAKLHGLQAAGNLPSTDWYSHAADIPHGETVALDMSSWTRLKGGGPSTKEAIWYICPYNREITPFIRKSERRLHLFCLGFGQMSRCS
jgi:hypothetical protein